MPWRQRNIPRVILDRFGMTHFFIIFLHNFQDFSQTCELYISGALCPFPLKPVQILVCLYKENTTKQHYLFLFIAPLINSIQVQKITNNIKNMSLGAWEQVLWLVPGWPRITLKEHRYMLYESFKVTLEARRMATHASAWRKWENDTQNLSEWQVFVNFFNFFRKAQDHLKWC